MRVIWTFHLDDPAAFGPPERVSPDSLIEVIFNWRNPFAMRYAGKGFVALPGSCAVSQTRRFVEIRPVGPSGFISVRFHPWGAYHFMRKPVSEIADRVAPTDALWGRHVVDLEDQLATASDDRQRVTLVEEFLLAQLQRHRKEDVEPLVRAVWRRQGRTTVAQLCDELGIGERRLERTFAAAFGTAPKSFVRLSRFLHTCRVLRTGRVGTLANVAYRCGYSDQSHFNADFKAFIGMTPRDFLTNERVYYLETG